MSLSYLITIASGGIFWLTGVRSLKRRTMANNIYRPVAYGLSDALLNVFPAPIVGVRNPTAADKAQIGSIWVNKTSNDAWVLTSIANNAAVWTGIGGGSGTFTSLTVNPGNITATAGNISATAGSVSAGTTVTAGTGITATTGNITATTGNLIATAGNITATAGNITATAGNITATAGEVVAGGIVEGQSLVATGDSGGFALSTTLSSATSTALSSGTLSIKSESANPGNNTGFLKFYVGVTPVYVPYFATIAP
jgi:hypothetical protein